MKTLSPAGGHITQRRYRLPETAAALVAVTIGVFALTARAQSSESMRLKSRNPYIRKIERQYNDLNYEAALAQIPQARKYSGNTDREYLWLELMEGILYHGLKQYDQTDMVFMRVFERAPDALLPIPNPSQTLKQRFEALKKAFLQTRSTQASGTPEDSTAPANISKMALLAKLRELEALLLNWADGPLPGPVNDALRKLFDETVEADSPEERQAIASRIDAWIKAINNNDVKGVEELAAPPAPPEPGLPARSISITASDASTSSAPVSVIDLLRRALSPAVLNDRLRRMREWLVIKSEEGATPQLSNLRTQLNEHFHALEAADTSHKRMRVAINLDKLEYQLSIATGWRIQGSIVRAITIDSK
jgi:hypothetical protein